jgi:ABC-type ATPase with predicted acetyltransferase domain
MYDSKEIAEEVLLETWSRFEFASNNGPVAVYQCEDCGRYHLTSKGPMNEKLAQALREGKIQRQKEANRWADKLKRR